MASPVPSGTGFEKAILAISIGIGKAENAIMDVSYGKPDGTGGIKFPGNKKKTSGIIPILREINKIDLCNILNYMLGSINLTGGTLGKKLKKLHDAAKELSDILDGSFIQPAQARNPEKIAKLILYLGMLDSLLDRDICSIFPKIQVFKNNLKDIVGVLIQYNAAVATYTVDTFSVTQQSAVVAAAEQRAAQETDSFLKKEYERQAEAERLKLAEVKANLKEQQKDAGKATADAALSALNRIPNEEVQKVMNTIRDVKQVLNIIMSITSVGDIASRLIPNQIQELQKILNPAQLLPMIRMILTLAKGFNQICQTILGFVGIVRVIVKVLQVLLIAVKILIMIFRLLPLPLMFATHGVVDGLIWGRQLLDQKIDDAIKRVSQIGRLIDVVYAFVLNIISILEEIIAQIEILIFTLESCNATNTEYDSNSEYGIGQEDYNPNEDGSFFGGGVGGGAAGGAGGVGGGRGTGAGGTGTGTGAGGRTGPGTGGAGGAGDTGAGTGGYSQTAPLLKDLRSTKGELMNTLDQLKGLTDAYDKAKKNANEAVYNGYTMKIEEEELADKGVKNKRRRALAFDQNGVLVMATDLTFATATSILFEELRLKLINAGLVQDTGLAIPKLDGVLDALSLPETSADMLNSIGIKVENGQTPEDMLKSDLKEVQNQINTVVGSIKGSSDLKKSVQKTSNPENKTLKEDIKSDKVDPLANQKITGGLQKVEDSVKVNTGNSNNPDKLSDREVVRLQEIIKNANSDPNSAELKKTLTYKQAIRKLAANEKARR